VLGVDLGKEQDFLVVTRMNGYGEAEIIGRWRHVKWTESVPELVRMAREHKAPIVLDVGAGGGTGGVCKDYLERDGVVVEAVTTGKVGTKAQIVEQCRADVQWERIRVLENAHSDQLRHELSLFQGIKRIAQGGQEVTHYEGPQLRGEHDDCVISLCLANWGRVKGLSPDDDDYDASAELAEFARVNQHLARRFPYRSGPSFHTGGSS
jgi:hypothetical protein